MFSMKSSYKSLDKKEIRKATPKKTENEKSLLLDADYPENLPKQKTKILKMLKKQIVKMHSLKH